MSPNMYFKFTCRTVCLVTHGTTVLLSFGLISHQLCCTIPIHFWLKIWGAVYLLIGTVTTYQFPKIITVI